MPKKLLYPQYWLIWCGVFVLRLLVLLPFSWQLALGRALGVLIYWLAKNRRHFAKVNIDLCFREKSAQERAKILKDSFKCAGMGIMEALTAWFMSERRFNKIPFHWQGEAYYQDLLKKGHGIIAVGGHFTCLEISGRFFGERIPVCLVYKASHNPVFEYIVSTSRKRYIKAIISHKNIKEMIQHLQKNEVVWYAPDQDFGRTRSVWVPWFNVPAATITGVSTLAKKSGALVVPVYFRRLKNGGYVAESTDALENFPSGDPAQDAARWQKLLEDFVRKYPEDYLWGHRRFKTRPEGHPSIY